ncbi:uncharacterized protein RJT20DRAFT_15891 [Scheffersomyces xylosifermentans]|uniref:uncharacterized protein n=1 Tax=Scheffersomyces xylosifermentans TaxID=1304137 RepID=UPI00315DAADB
MVITLYLISSSSKLSKICDSLFSEIEAIIRLWYSSGFSESFAFGLLVICLIAIPFLLIKYFLFLGFCAYTLFVVVVVVILVVVCHLPIAICCVLLHLLLTFPLVTIQQTSLLCLSAANFVSGLHYSFS